MKKIVLALLTFAFIQGASAQFTGGGEATQTPNAAASSVPGGGGMYLKFGMATPGGDLKTMAFKQGWLIDFAIMPYFGKPDSKVKGGMIIADDMAFYPGGEHPNPTTNKTGKDLLITLGMKLGPAITFSPLEKMNIDAYFGIHPTFALGTVNGIDQMKYISLMKTFGFNFRYSKLIVGLEFDSGKMKFQSDDKGGNYTKNAPSTRLMLGVRLK
jgi:hypothetical protein